VVGRDALPTVPNLLKLVQSDVEKDRSVFQLVEALATASSLYIRRHRNGA
jgi:hypothetical protein